MPSALDLFDEAFHRLRLAPTSTLGFYYAGTLPFVLALLYFWADQSRSPDAAGHATGGALAVAVLFVLMKVCHAAFAARLTAQLRRTHPTPWTWTRLGRLAFVQAIVQPPGLFVLAVASIFVVPLGWAYAFYQNVTVFGDGSEASAGAVSRRAWRAARRLPRQNHVGLTLLSLVGFFVFLNLLVAVVGIPYLVRMFTGEDNLVTRSGWHLANTTFFAIVSGLVYLALDPLAKAFYTLRCFYDDSRRTGEDLLGELAALPPAFHSGAAVASPTAAPGPAPAARPRPAAAVPTILLVLFGLFTPLLAGPLRATDAPAAASSSAIPAPRTVSPPALGRSIDDVLQRRKFAWRLPRKDEPEVHGPLDDFLRRLRAWRQAAWKSVLGWYRAVKDWLRRWWNPREAAPAQSAGFGGLSVATSHGLMAALASLLGGTILYLGWRQWHARRTPVVTGQAVPVGGSLPPDLAADDILATQLPEDEWLRLAQTLLQNGERRLALRALYLSGLSSLAARGLLAIARHKSNRDYLLELRRRARAQPELQGAFGRNLTRFERVWYGSHPADDALLADFQADRAKVLA